MNKKIQLSIMSIFIAAALVGSVITFGDNMAFANKKTSNEGAQFLINYQKQANFQNVQQKIIHLHLAIM